MMRRIIVMVVVVSLIAVAGEASAFNFANGPNLGKMSDWGSFVDPDTGTPLPTAPPEVGDWDITVARVTQLFAPDLPLAENQYYNGVNPELTLMIYDLQVTNVVTVIAPNTRFPGDPGAFNVELGSSGRYTSDGSPYTGGRIDLWEDPSNDFTPAGNGGYPNDWVFNTPSGAGWWVDPFDAGEYDTFPTAVEGTPVLSGTLVDPDGAGPQPLLSLYLDYAFGTGFNNSFGYIDVTYNPQGHLFLPESLASGATYDISFFNNFTFYPNASFNNVYEPRVDDPTTDTVYWNTESQDPIRFTIIPEPTTFALLASGVVGLIGVIRRRKRA